MDITRAVSAVLRREGVGSGGNAPGTGALPIRPFVPNPLWGFNCKLMDQKELSSQIGEERRQPASPFILLPRERVSTNPLRTSNGQKKSRSARKVLQRTDPLTGGG